jgi:hypothetical protein
MKMVVMVVVIIVVMVVMMGQPVTTDCPLLVLLNTSQCGHRSQLQFQTQELQATEHVTLIPVNKTVFCRERVLFY